ncbi:F0F1 ATP synthase subunit delta [candidate division WWE3 bacterium]|uniref:F0F1 ATP synthase subunit delta n=1 Tax=candidate division WWE3 bacterium TaxID=2053526 RepID=A0A955RX49_UNCKA|nr:F0F1 ATP synthase subunit delta [candidate division WWE3 bacterium]
MKEEKNNVAQVEFAGQLDTATQNELTQKIKEKFTSVETIEFVENTQLIAGIKIVFQDFVYEDSVKHKLVQLRNA